MRRSLSLLASLSIYILSLCHAAPALAAAPAFQRLTLGSYEFPIYSNRSLTGDLSDITRVVMVHHGIQRNGDDYYAAAAELLAGAGVAGATTLILAPNFFDDVDRAKHDDLAQLPLWHKDGWMAGEPAVVGNSVSSFQVLDDIVVWLTDKKRLPKLTAIVVAGHSGGAQMVQRYAALNNIDETVRQRGYDLRYVVANPSSYLYFDARRPAEGGAFLPYDRGQCQNYNAYRYGMDGIVSYADGHDGASLFARYSQRQVDYLWGSNDTDPNHRVLDKSCGAEAEGPTRYTRGHNYWRYLGLLRAAQPVPFTQHAHDVEGVGHDQSKMFGSSCGQSLLFAIADATTGAQCVAVAPAP